MQNYGVGEFFRGAIGLVLAGTSAAKGGVGLLGKADPSGKRRMRDDNVFCWSGNFRLQAMRIAAKPAGRCLRCGVVVLWRGLDGEIYF